MRTRFSIVLLSLLVATGCNEKTNGWDAKDYGGAAPVKGKAIAVFRSETCGCCKQWILHLQKHGFVVEDHVVADMTETKRRYGVPQEVASCHTAVVDGYVIEGHVPAQDIVPLLAKKPEDITGLSVPAMPTGTPGMEDEQAGRKDPFSVVAFSKSGSRLYRRYETY